MPKYYICPACIGRKIEEIELLTPCVRFLNDDYDYINSFPNNCPKRARGVEIIDTPTWRLVSEEVFDYFSKLNEEYGTRVRIYIDED